MHPFLKLKPLLMALHTFKVWFGSKERNDVDSLQHNIATCTFNVMGATTHNMAAVGSSRQ